MKKNAKLQTIIIAAAALMVGFLSGFYMDNLPPDGDDLAGTIGKVDRYRNVQVTENDIQLRNELVGDTAKLLQYKKYLTYFYLQAELTQKDIEAVLDKTKNEGDFSQKNQQAILNLQAYNEYLKTARTDIMSALKTIAELNASEDIPVIVYLNLAQNAIARIQSNETMLIYYMSAIEDYVAANKETDYPELADAHDLLALHTIEAAMMMDNKPVLKYLDKKELMNDAEGLKIFRISSAVSLSSDHMNSAIAMDSERLKCDAETLKAVIGSNPVIMDHFMGSTDRLNLMGTIGELNSQTSLHALEQMGSAALMFDVEKMNWALLYDVETMNDIVNMESKLGITFNN